eukprot:1269455-Rhodomonas_salina.1
MGTEHSGGTEDEDPEKDQKYLAETPLKELTTQLTLEAEPLWKSAVLTRRTPHRMGSRRK